MPEGQFDHSPGLLTVYPRIGGGRKPFKYFTMWKSSPVFNDTIQAAWNTQVSGRKMFMLVSKLKTVKIALKDLNKSGFSDVQAADLNAHHDMVAAQELMHANPTYQCLSNKELEAIQEYKIKHKAYLDFLSQKAKLAWIKAGDENTTLFHQSIKSRNIQNQVYSIHDKEGRWRDKPGEVSEAFIEYYKLLLGSVQESRTPVIKQAGCPNWSSVKAPGPDGFDVLHHGKLLKEVNHTVVTLIPKTKCPRNVGDFRPISCCNTLYKCITKVLCGRLRQVLPDLILENQGGFVHGRYSQYKGSAGPSEFLREMMECLEFPVQFVNIVMECVTTPMFSLMINGSMHGFFKSQRGLRQGDPISPLLFVICMEYLSRILQKMSALSQFQFHPRCKELFSNSSGLKANHQKPSIYCHGMSDGDVQRVVDASGFVRSTLPFKYLGVPICSKKISAAQCGVLVDKMTARIKLWSSRNLSYTARMQLVNSVLLSLYMYWTQIYVLPKSVLQDIVKICRAFLWSGHAYSSKPSSIAWERICCDKQSGGLGFRDVLLWNIASIGKYVWALATKQDNVWIKWVTSVYLKDGEWWDYQPNNTASWYWKQVCSTKEKLKMVFTEAEIGAMSKYSAKQVYNNLAGNRPKVHWDRLVWNRLNTPKHRFISWLAIQSRLQTTAKMAKIGISSSESCLICGQKDEDHHHLFFNCSYSKQCLVAMKAWLGINTTAVDLHQLYRSIKHGRHSKFRKQVYYAAIVALVYLIWRCRNTSLWDQLVPAVKVTVGTLKQTVKSRIQAILPKYVNRKDNSWFVSL
ncbi:uncharacterized protein [Spinacia oleracea]|uniref:Reverse transcriptase domain-containing protein n=1 Tax=Spinacia oleracea TaxID=3562 RepID=A0ABM3RJ11_SPIOL|nr:uncharacterized protein LOC110800415 [Spinacia oleracea]